MLLNDRQILNYCKEGMITPYSETCIRKLEGGTPAISSGISPYGYDVILDPEVKIMVQPPSDESVINIIDPKRPESMTGLFEIGEVNRTMLNEEYVLLPPYGFALGKCKHKFKLPTNVTVFCMTKSTHARAAISVKTTPVQAGFEGDVVLEIKNDSPYYARLYVNEGVAQFFFFEGEDPEVDYAMSGGVYQYQSGIQLPRT